MAMSSDLFRDLQSALQLPRVTKAEQEAIIASFEATGGELSDEQRQTIERTSTEPVTQEAQQEFIEESIEISQNQPIDIRSEVLRKGGIPQDRLGTASTILAQLNQSGIEFRLKDVPFVSEQIRSGQLRGISPEGIADSIIQRVQPLREREQIQVQQQELEEVLAERERELLSQQEIEREFTAAGGLPDPQSLAQLAGVSTVEEAQAIAQESIARQQDLEEGRLAEFETERGRLSEELARLGGRELELAQPEIQRRLQSLGILRGGEQIRQTQEAAERLTAERQRILAGFGREDILQARALEEQFGQQARGLALEERGRILGGLEQALGTRLGVTREDILGAQRFGRQRTLQTQQLAAAAREAERQRQFEREIELARIQRATELAELQRRRQRRGFFGQIIGGLGGALLGGFTPLGGIGGAGLGAILGGGFGGGVPSPFGQSLFEESVIQGFPGARSRRFGTTITTEGDIDGDISFDRERSSPSRNIF